MTLEEGSQLGTLIGVIVLAVWNVVNHRERRRVDAITTRTLGEIHQMGNHEQQILKQTVMLLAEWKANSTKHPEDVATAAQARVDYELHLVNQSIVDRTNEAFKLGQQSR